MFDIASLSRTGGRAANEDYADFLQGPAASCWVLADGLGGHRGGDIASRTVVEAALASFRARPDVSADAVRAHIAHAQAALVAAQQQTPSLAQMRSTIVVLVSTDRHAVWGHVGDSRLYHVRGGQVVERTRDHSVSQALVDGGQIQPQAQGAHEDRGRLLRCLGQDGDAGPTVSGPHALARGDAFLLCTDGFWEALDDIALALDFAGADDGAAWLDRMEARLRRRMGAAHDNYTATAVRVTSDAAPPPAPHDPEKTPSPSPPQPPSRSPMKEERCGRGGRTAPSDQASLPRHQANAARHDASLPRHQANAPRHDASSPRHDARIPHDVHALARRRSPATLAAVVVLLLVLTGAGVWQRHRVITWMKTLIASVVRVEPAPKAPVEGGTPDGAQPPADPKQDTPATPPGEDPATREPQRGEKGVEGRGGAAAPEANPKRESSKPASDPRKPEPVSTPGPRDTNVASPPKGAPR